MADSRALPPAAVAAWRPLSQLMLTADADAERPPQAPPPDEERIMLSREGLTTPCELPLG